MNDHELAARALDVNAANLALGHETLRIDGATIVRDRRITNIYDANHVRDVTAATPAEIDALLILVEKEFAGYGHRMFHVDFRTPPQFEARLQFEGYTRSDALVLILEGQLRGAAPPCDVRPIEGEADWAWFRALSAVDWQESSSREGKPEEPSVGEGLALANRWKSPPARFYLAWADGEPRGYFNAWEGIDGVGQVENLFVHPDWRHRGLATALVYQCVADARAHGAGPVVIVADPTDTPKRMYAAMGWRPIAVMREYKRELVDGRSDVST